MSRRALGWLFAAGYVATIFAANWAIERYGAVDVGFGEMAPAGVWFAGLAFTLRDLTQNALGKVPVLVAIAVGGAASALVADADLVTASVVAFLVSELADFGVYTPLARRGWLGAVLVSNAVGLVVDSALFLQIAFDDLAFFKGQVIGKAWMTLAAIVVLAPVHRRRELRPASAAL